MGSVSDAIIVAGGHGTRMLPASASIPKESLPLVDVPIIVHLAREAIFAGVKRIHIISNPEKDLSEILSDNSHFAALRSGIDAALLNPAKEVQVIHHTQLEQKGLGDAIQTALELIEGPFLVLLGDNLLMDSHSSTSSFSPSSASKKLVEAYEKTGNPCSGLIEVDNPSLYGVVSLEGELITGIIEKPQENPPSNLALCGRYLFDSDSAELLEKYAHHGELASISIQQHWIDESRLVGVYLKGYQWYDSGSPLLWLTSQIDHALRRPDLSEELENWLMRRLQR